MKRFMLLALALIGCDVEQPGFQCEQDPWLVEWEQAPVESTQCPAGMPIQYDGKGCVPCLFYDVCGAKYDPVGCSPAPGVFCYNGTITCPNGYEIPQDMTVKEGAF